VSFLAAVVLYVFAVQDVQGFAFTLGLSTVLDLLIVFLVTHPLVALASRSKTLSRPGLSGLGAVQRAGAAVRAAKTAAAAAVKEA
jgi:preprotein translocase subunit SecD